MIILFIFLVLGLIVGSFLNVVIYRIHAEEDGIVDGRSRCRSCKKDLLWQDNIPLFSYLFLKGKCRFCKAPISSQYPAVEFSGMILALIASAGALSTYSSQYFLAGVVGVLTFFVFACMLVVFVYDYKYMEVPMNVIVWGSIFAVVLLLVKDFYTSEAFSFFASHLFLHGIAGGLCFLFFFTLSYVSKEQWMGYGDGFIALVIGLLLGPLSAFVGILIAVLSGATIGILLTLSSQKTMKSAIPFGPFLVFGMVASYVITVFWPELLTYIWY